MGKRIWIVNYYTSPTCSNPRYQEFATAFLLAGYEVVTFNAAWVDKLDFKGAFKEENYGLYNFVHINAPKYQGNGLKRMWSIFNFAMKLYLNRRKFEKPDIILHNIHTPFDYPVYEAAKRLKAKYIAEAWDMWPEDFVTFGLLKANSPVMKFAYHVERKLYENADQVIFTQEGGPVYLKNKGWTTDCGGTIDPAKVHYINSGVNLEKFDNDCKAHPRHDADLNDSETYKIIYLGSIRLVNHVKELIDAAAILMDNPKYRFFIYGDGNERLELEQYVKEKEITNVIFKEKQIPFEEVAWVVSQATVNVMNYQKNFGIHGVSSGKMFQYFAAGKPILCNIKLNYSEINRNNIGIDRDIETPEQYADAIRELTEQSKEDYDAMCKRVRATAHKFDYKYLAAKELTVLES